MSKSYIENKEISHFLNSSVGSDVWKQKEQKIIKLMKVINSNQRNNIEQNTKKNVEFNFQSLDKPKFNKEIERNIILQQVKSRSKYGRFSHNMFLPKNLASVLSQENRHIESQNNTHKQIKKINKEQLIKKYQGRSSVGIMQLVKIKERKLSHIKLSQINKQSSKIQISNKITRFNINNNYSSNDQNLQRKQNNKKQFNKNIISNLFKINQGKKFNNFNNAVNNSIQKIKYLTAPNDSFEKSNRIRLHVQSKNKLNKNFGGDKRFIKHNNAVQANINLNYGFQHKNLQESQYKIQSNGNKKNFRVEKLQSYFIPKSKIQIQQQVKDKLQSIYNYSNASFQLKSSSLNKSVHNSSSQFNTVSNKTSRIQNYSNRKAEKNQKYNNSANKTKYSASLFPTYDKNTQENDQKNTQNMHKKLKQQSLNLYAKEQQKQMRRFMDMNFTRYNINQLQSLHRSLLEYAKGDIRLLKKGMVIVMNMSGILIQEEKIDKVALQLKEYNNKQNKLSTSRKQFFKLQNNQIDNVRLMSNSKRMQKTMNLTFDKNMKYTDRTNYTKSKFDEMKSSKYIGSMTTITSRKNAKMAKIKNNIGVNISKLLQQNLKKIADFDKFIELYRIIETHYFKQSIIDYLDIMFSNTIACKTDTQQKVNNQSKRASRNKHLQFTQQSGAQIYQKQQIVEQLQPQIGYDDIYQAFHRRSSTEKAKQIANHFQKKIKQHCKQNIKSTYYSTKKMNQTTSSTQQLKNYKLKQEWRIKLGQLYNLCYYDNQLCQIIYEHHMKQARQKHEPNPKKQQNVEDKLIRDIKRKKTGNTEKTFLHNNQNEKKTQQELLRELNEQLAKQQEQFHVQS